MVDLKFPILVDVSEMSRNYLHKVHEIKRIKSTISYTIHLYPTQHLSSILQLGMFKFLSHNICHQDICNYTFISYRKPLPITPTCLTTTTHRSHSCLKTVSLNPDILGSNPSPHDYVLLNLWFNFVVNIIFILKLIIFSSLSLSSPLSWHISKVIGVCYMNSGSPCNAASRNPCVEIYVPEFYEKNL